MKSTFLILGAALLSVVLAVVPSARGQLAFTTNLYTVGGSPFAVATADVNGDGKPDLISANSGASSLTVLTNNGSGIFGFYATVAASINPVFVAAVDINGDGKPDLISANYGANSLTVQTNTGKGGFVLSATLTIAISNPDGLAVADVNGDGIPDLICANGANGNNTLTIYFGAGAGQFTPNAVIGLGDSPAYVVAADINGDGKPDLITANAGGTLSILTNTGSGSFNFATTNIMVGTSANSVQVVDVNGDGKPDLVCATSQGIVILTNNTHGVFGPYATIPLTSAATSVAVTNFSGTTKMDIACAEINNAVQVFTNNGSGGFGLNATVNFTIPQKSLVTTDVNGDGKPDLITANYTTSPTLTVLTQTTAAGPLLKITRPTATSIVISWVSANTSLILQTNNNLATNNWLPCNLPISITGGTNQSSTFTPAPPGKLFFRLY